MNNINYNTEHQRLTKQLGEIITQKKSIKDSKLREKYQSTNDDPSPIFYQIIAERNKKDRLMQTCDIMNSDATVKETLSHPADIAAHTFLQRMPNCSIVSLILAWKH